MENQEPITIVVATDDFYAVLLAALIKSIELTHKTPERINIHIIDDGISARNIQMISQTTQSDVFTLFWHKTANVVPEGIVLPNDSSAFPITTYLRLFSPYLIPKDVSKMIYLDVDMIVVEDISTLWETNLQNKLFAAAIDLCKTVGSTWGGIPNYKELGLNPNSKYFNAGLMVIDPVKWREQDISNKVIKAINDNIRSVNFADQYGLNVVLVDQWLQLDHRWNSFSVLNETHPYLIHFLDIKPIFKSYNANREYYKLFHFYLSQTPYANFRLLGDYRRIYRKALIKIGKKIKGIFLN